jgi:hypothetical protein
VEEIGKGDRSSSSAAEEILFLVKQTEPKPHPALIQLSSESLSGP